MDVETKTQETTEQDVALNDTSLSIDRPNTAVATAPTRRPSGPRTKAQGDWKPAFLEAYTRLGTIHHAALEVGINRVTVTDRQGTDPVFAASMVVAREAFNDTLERELFRRAVKGRDEPLVYRGRKTGESIRKRSDPLLKFALEKRRYPATVEITGGATVTLDWSGMFQTRAIDTVISQEVISDQSTAQIAQDAILDHSDAKPTDETV